MDNKDLTQAITLALQFTQANTDDIRMSIFHQLGTNPTDHARFMQSLVQIG